MASQLKVDTLTGVTTAGSIVVTGEGNSTTTNLQQGLAKAWIHFQGTSTAAINDSFNISGLTDNGTGNYTVTILNDMVNVSYSSPCAASDSGITNSDTMVNPYTWATGSVSIGTNNNSGTLVDRSDTNITIHGDLA
tara:strand:- start:22 stop:429 length:408 start_codon:yes stop_codon:yes gene_type:complete